MLREALAIQRGTRCQASYLEMGLGDLYSPNESRLPID
jgi:hypothetical protein